LKQTVSGEGQLESWQQELVFVAESNFTIPSIRLRYFDPQLRRVRWVQTQAVPIHVTGAESRRIAPGHDKDAARLKAEGNSIPFILGTIAAAVVILLGRRWWPNAQQKAGRGTGDDYRDALRLLLAHREEPDVEEMIIKLEASLYAQEAENVDRKTLKQLLKRYRK